MSEEQAAFALAVLESAGYELATMYRRRGRWLVGAWRGGEWCVWSDFGVFV